MFINDNVCWFEMSDAFKLAEEQHFDALPRGFDEALFRDCLMLFFGL